jgi:multimeric flavodoxin WrbA
MPNILAIYGSPRRKGNTSVLLQKAVEGARKGGAEVEEIVLRDLKPVLRSMVARRRVGASSKTISRPSTIRFCPAMV